MIFPVYFHKKEDGLSTHSLYPRGGCSRFLLPERTKAANVGLSFFLASSQRQILWAKNLIYSYRKNSNFALSKQVQDLLSFTTSDTELCTVSLGTAGPYQKQTILQIDNQLAPLSIFKIGTSEATHKNLKNEANKLKWLNQNEKLSRYTPEMLGENQNHGIYAIKESVGFGTTVHINGDLQSICTFLHTLHQESEQLLLFSNSNVFQLLKIRYESLKPNLTHDWQQRANHHLRQLARLGSQKFRFVLAHRDFAKWNMNVSHKGLFVYDWEYSQFGYPSLYDLFHLHLIPKALKGKLFGNFSIINNLCRNKIFDLFYHEYDLPKLSQLVIYLLDLCLFYLESNSGQSEKDIVVQQYASMLDLLEKKYVY